jgi:glyoxylase-like metal-dependent hydrolase (beta-lactamase superfamily II)
MRLFNSSAQILTGILLSFSAYAWNLPVGDFEFVAVADNVYVMHGPLSQPTEQNRGFMNNPAVIEGKTGLILIDPGSSLQVGDKVLEEVAKISTKPVLAVFNSHIHGDHWLANQAVKRAYPEIDIYAHAKMIAQSQASEGAAWLNLMLQRTGGFTRGTEIVPANKAIKNNDRIVIDGEEFIIHSLLPSHTDTDIMIEHVGSRTIFMGDNCFNLRMGRFDNSGSIIGNIAALEYIAALNFVNVVPGHGPSGGNEDIIMPFLDYLRELEKVVAEGQEAELEDYEIKEKVLSQFVYISHWSEFDVQFGPNLNKMYLELEAF